jgi:hypothetical protein
MEFAKTHNQSIDYRIRNIYGETPLHYASKWDYLETVKLLIDHSDLSICDHQGRTALDVAGPIVKAFMCGTYLDSADIKEPENS